MIIWHPQRDQFSFSADVPAFAVDAIPVRTAALELRCLAAFHFELHPWLSTAECLETSIAVHIDANVAGVAAIAVPQPFFFQNAMAHHAVVTIIRRRADQTCQLCVVISDYRLMW